MGTINNPTDVSSLAGVTMTGDINLGENALGLDESIGTDQNYSGDVCSGTLGATIAVGEIVYLDDADDKWKKAQANATGTSIGLLGICLVAGDDTDTTTILLRGFYRDDTAFNYASAGVPLYLSDTTAGDFIEIAPDTAGDVVRVIAYAHDDADTVYFNPSGAWVEVA